ncbi:10229_t:CDS:2, partial [Entrophospora sp. SA101]
MSDPQNVVSNPYFINLLQQLRPAYQPPSKSVLSGKFLDTEISNVNNKLNSILENNKNLTL